MICRAQVLVMRAVLAEHCCVDLGGSWTPGACIIRPQCNAWCVEEKSADRSHVSFPVIGKQAQPTCTLLLLC
jgi:hypothetical protein